MEQERYFCERCGTPAGYGLCDTCVLDMGHEPHLRGMPRWVYVKGVEDIQTGEYL